MFEPRRHGRWVEVVDLTLAQHSQIVSPRDTAAGRTGEAPQGKFQVRIALVAVRRGLAPSIHVSLSQEPAFWSLLNWMGFARLGRHKLHENRNRPQSLDRTSRHRHSLHVDAGGHDRSWLRDSVPLDRLIRWHRTVVSLSLAQFRSLRGYAGAKSPGTGGGFQTKTLPSGGGTTSQRGSVTTN